MSAERKASAAAVSVHTAEHPNPTPPLLLRASVLLTRASARLGEAAAAMDQAQRDIAAVTAEVPPGLLYEHNTLRAQVLLRLLEAKSAKVRMMLLAQQADRLAAPRPAGAEEGGAQ